MDYLFTIFSFSPLNIKNRLEEAHIIPKEELHEKKNGRKAEKMHGWCSQLAKGEVCSQWDGWVEGKDCVLVFWFRMERKVTLNKIRILEAFGLTFSICYSSTHIISDDIHNRSSRTEKSLR